MNWFFINTHERNLAVLGFLADNNNSIKKYKVKPGALMKVFNKNFTKQDIAKAEGIILVTGPGSFSAIRAGVLIGNLLARIYQKPLYAISNKDSCDLPRLISRIQKSKLAPTNYAEPVYDAKPNITKPKHI